MIAIEIESPHPVQIERSQLRACKVSDQWIHGYNGAVRACCVEGARALTQHKLGRMSADFVNGWHTGLALCSALGVRLEAAPMPLTRRPESRP